MLTLQTYEIGKEGAKWKLNNDGSIESVKCSGMVISKGGGAGTDLSLVSRTELTTGSSQTWRRHNVRFLDSAAALSQEWIQDWSVSFDSTEQGYNISSLQEFSGSTDDVTKKCYPPNPAFNRAFEDFASGFVINTAADEDECKAAREEMGFEPDHPFDTDVCHSFKEHMCDPFFTGIDHMTETLAVQPKFEPVPPKFEPVEYEEEEYEEVEYEAPE